MKPVINRKGYITLEAAIVLPVFILAIIAIGFYIKVFTAVENVSYSMIDETAKLASRAYVTENAPFFKMDLEHRITEGTSEAENVNVTKFRYLYHDGDMDNMISAEVKYQIKSQLSLQFGHVFSLTSQIKCRGFTGLEKTGEPMSFDEMESEGTWIPVWIFPNDGEKYHAEECTHVKVNAQEIVLTDSVKKKYKACKLCDSEKAKIGAYVYCFPDNGEAYHTENCQQVDKYTIEVNRDEAVNKGYLPCSKCGGG